MKSNYVKIRQEHKVVDFEICVARDDDNSRVANGRNLTVCAVCMRIQAGKEVASKFLWPMEPPVWTDLFLTWHAQR